MEGFLKQNTAVSVTVLVVATADHFTGLTGATLVIYASKAAGTPALITPTVTELDATNVKGVYKLALTGTHTNTLGELQLHITATGADPANFKWSVVTYLPGEAATLQADQAVNATKLGGTTQTGRDIGASVLLSAGTGAGQLDFTSGVVKANPSAAVIAAAVWDEADAGHLSLGTMGVQQARIGTVTAVSTGPQVRAGEFQIYKGDDYYVADARQLAVSEPSSLWPTLVAATVAFEVRKADLSGWWSGGSATVVNAGVAGAQQVRGLPTATQTAAMDQGYTLYRFRATLASGHIITLAEGKVLVVPA